MNYQILNIEIPGTEHNRSKALANGDKTYMGKQCPKGHKGLRYTVYRNCVECSNTKEPTGEPVGRPMLKEKKAAIEAGEDFYFTGKMCQHGHIAKRYVKNSYCVECEATVYKELDRNLNRGYNLKKYGVTEEKYQEMLKAQNELCAICLNPETATDNRMGGSVKRLAIDHCHTTGKVRGLLCQRCNQGIGNFKHNSKFLKRAAAYCEEL